MKKLLSLLLALILVMSLAACTEGDGGVTDDTTTAPSTTAPTAPQAAVPESALDVLEKTWALYGEEEKFSIYGGNPEGMNLDTPANWDLAYSEGMTYSLLVPADSVASVESAASMIHMMNPNTFTCGVFTLTEGTDIQAFATTMRDAVMNNQWMCGFPERLVVQVIGEEYVLVAFGLGDAMTPFCGKLATAWPSAATVYDEAIG